MNRVMLPGELQRAIERARQAMLADPVHALRPFYRRQVYGALGPDEATHARAHAGIRCARRVLPVWQGVWPDDPLPERLITMAGRVLRGEVGAEDTRRTAGAAFDALAERGSGAPEEQWAAFYAGCAAMEALFEAAGEHRERFDGVILEERDEEADLDPWSANTPHWAASAYAGGEWQARSDSERRREFWDWWLDEVIPEAWGASQR